MGITLQPELEAKLRSRAKKQGASIDSYIEHLLFIDDVTRESLEQAALEGLNSGEPVEGDQAFWEERHRKLDEYVKGLEMR